MNFAVSAAQFGLSMSIVSIAINASLFHGKGFVNEKIEYLFCFILKEFEIIIKPFPNKVFSNLDRFYFLGLDIKKYKYILY